MDYIEMLNAKNERVKNNKNNYKENLLKKNFNSMLLENLENNYKKSKVKKVLYKGKWINPKNPPIPKPTGKNKTATIELGGA